MSLKYEACYLVVDVGEFDLVTSRFQFGNILTAARPLLTARVRYTILSQGFIDTRAKV